MNHFQLRPLSAAADAQPVVPTLQDRRKVRRTKILGVGQVAFVGATLRCVILDVNDGGARLRLAENVRVPELLILRIGGGPDRAAKPRWQQASELGVQFL